MSLRPLLGLVLCALIALGLAFPDTSQAMDDKQIDCPGLYEAGDYRAAAACFEALEQSGTHNGHLLYNLGNAWYRAGDPARALLAYRRASLYLPRDGDLAANLESVRGQTKDDLDPPDTRSTLASTLLGPYDALSQRELLLVGGIAWALFMLLLAWRTRRELPYGLGLVLLTGSVAVFGLVGGGARSYQTSHSPIAVVLSPEVTVRSGRDVRSTDLVRLHAGAEVRALEEHDDWTQVLLSNGTRGWLPRESLGLVQPLP